MDCQATLHFSVSQCDFPSITGPISPAPIYVGVSCPAKRLLPQHRQDLAIQVLARTETVSELARQHEVSRKFLYQQVHTANRALDSAFAPVRRPDDVLFYLPVTKAWLRQLVLAMGSSVTMPASSSFWGPPAGSGNDGCRGVAGTNRCRGRSSCGWSSITVCPRPVWSTAC